MEPQSLDCGGGTSLPCGGVAQLVRARLEHRLEQRRASDRNVAGSMFVLSINYVVEFLRKT